MQWHWNGPVQPGMTTAGGNRNYVHPVPFAANW